MYRLDRRLYLYRLDRLFYLYRLDRLLYLYRLLKPFNTLQRTNKAVAASVHRVACRYVSLIRAGRQGFAELSVAALTALRLASGKPDPLCGISAILHSMASH